MVWPHPRDVILYARSFYYYDNMFIIYVCLICYFLKSGKICNRSLLQIIGGALRVNAILSSWLKSIARTFNNHSFDF